MLLSTPRRSRGFTIIELLVVIAVIGILSTAILAGTASARSKGRQSAALQTMKSIHDIAMLCVSTNVTTYTFCLPGATAAQGCPTGTAIGDTNNGGGGYLCASNPNARYTALPTGWVYCDGTPNTPQTTTNCGNDTSSLPQGSFRIRAESNNDGWLISCDEKGCTAAPDSN